MPGSDATATTMSAAEQFDWLVGQIEQLITDLPGSRFASFYHMLPLATRLLGLENPLFGRGKSPYSIFRCCRR